MAQTKIDGSGNVSRSGETENESIPKEQRKPDMKTDLDDGPLTGPAGEYLPRRYRTQRRDVKGSLADGNIREDR